MFKNQKGITLIALVITIIVLLILAGITIALIASNDSAPNKAGEAKIIQNVGAAKDAVAIEVANLTTSYYEAKYAGSQDTSDADNAGEYIAAHWGTSTPTTHTKPTVTGVTISNFTTANDKTTITLTSTDSRSSDGKVYSQIGELSDGGTITWTNAGTGSNPDGWVEE